MMISQSTSECPICHGDGFTFTKDAYGNEFAHECRCQAPKKVEGWLKNSGVNPKEYALKNFKTWKVNSDEAQKMLDLAQAFVEDKGALGMMFTGNNGTGKTHICISAAQEITRRRLIPHKYFAYTREMQRLRAMIYDAEAFERNMSKWIECPVLYIDDMFKFAHTKDYGIATQDLQIMFTLINSRYLNRKITIISCEDRLSKIKKIDEALASRIYEIVMPYAMTCEGKNKRLAGV